MTHHDVMFYESTSLRFECTACGKCCTGGPDHHVFLSEAEAEAMRAELGLSRGWFRRRYLRRLRSGELVTTMSGDGACVFLDRTGRCRVYGARPMQCRSYPFWPELMRSARAWQAEATRCEGINRGGVVAKRHIRDWLARQRDWDEEQRS
jgi:Fe-S-cluster containining protein